jgi:hypothetical protein
MVGAGGVPQALISRAITTAVSVEKRFMFGECLLMNLAVGVTTTKCGNAVVFDNNFPTAFCDVEAAKCFEILFAGNECSCAVLPYRPGKAIASDDQVSALTQGSHHIHGQNNRALWFALIGNGEICSGSLPGSKRLVTGILIVITVRVG